MSSAAKLRNRGIAIAGATAIVMTSFGPAAFAWDAPTTASKSDTAGVASVGIVDADKAKAGTQGAAVVTAGGQSQALGDLHMAIPHTFKKGDYIDVTLGSEAGDATKTDQRVTFAANPVVSLDGAYTAALRVDPTSAATEADTTEGTATKYVPGAGQATPGAPDVTVTLIDNGAGPATARLTFNSNADVSNADAKGILTLSGIKANIGSGIASGNVLLTANAFDAGSTTPKAGFFGTPTTTEANVTIVGYVPAASISGPAGSFVADGSTQTLGDVIVNRVSGAFATGDTPDFSASGALADSADAKATYFDAAGKQLAQVAATVNTGAGSVTSAAVPAAANGATRVVFSGVQVRPGVATNTYDFTLTDGGTGATIPASPLTSAKAGAKLNQTDIAAPTSLATVTLAAIKPVERVGGASRYETSAKIAAAFADVASTTAGSLGEADNVVIASGESFPDALSAGYLAQTKQAPVLLTQKGELPGVAKEFLRNRGVKNVYIVGGASAVSAAVEADLKATQAYDIDATHAKNATLPLDGKLQVVRISGTDRFDTNRAVNEYAAARATSPVGTTIPKFGQPSKKTAILASGMSPWDALAAGPLVAGAQGAGIGGGTIPVILTGSTGLAGAAGRQMDTLDIGHAIIVGGADVVSASTVDALTARGTTSDRLSGASRFATAAAVNEFALKDSVASATNPQPGFGFGGLTSVYLANGGVPSTTAWADALALGPAAAFGKTVINLTTATALPKETSDFLAAHKGVIDTVTPIGLGAAVSTEVANKANATVVG